VPDPDEPEPRDLQRELMLGHQARAAEREPSPDAD
jgi:polyphosphate kinase